MIRGTLRNNCRLGQLIAIVLRLSGEMMLKSIEDEWLGFSEMVFRKMKPSETQVVEIKKAFFAGAWSLFCAVEEIGEPHVSEDVGHAFLEARRAECLEFKERIMREYAETN